MSRTGATAAVLEIRKNNGEVLLHQGYGWLDAGRTQPTRPDTMMRILSITKPFVHMAINQLAAGGVLSKNAKAFCLNNETPSGAGCLLKIAPAGGDGLPDPGAKDITVQQLLDHKAGWNEATADANGVFEPAAGSITVARILNVPSPPAVDQLIAYQLDQPLDYPPGSQSIYSNFGYTVLGRIVERYSGMGFMQYIYESLTDDLDIPRTDIELGKELVAQRNTREPRYIDRTGTPVPNLFDPAGPQVQWPDGGFLLERAPGAGGIICTSSALLDYMHGYWLFNPAPRSPVDAFVWIAAGGGPGTAAFATQNSPLPGFGTLADWVVNINTNPLNDSLQQDLWDLIRNTLVRNVATRDNTGAAGSQQFFTLYVPEGSADLEFRTQGGSGDIDLYVRFGARPATSAFDCRSLAAGTGHVCTIPNPASGTYYAMIIGNSAYAAVSITGNYADD